MFAQPLGGGHAFAESPFDDLVRALVKRCIGGRETCIHGEGVVGVMLWKSGFGGVEVWHILSLMPCSFVISGLAKEERAGRGIFRPGSLFGPLHIKGIWKSRI